MLNDPQGKFRVDPIFHGLCLDVGLHLSGPGLVALQVKGIGRHLKGSFGLRLMAFINGHLHGQGWTLRSLGGNCLYAWFREVRSEGHHGQGVKGEAKKLLDRRGKHGGIIHEGEYKAKVQFDSITPLGDARWRTAVPAKSLKSLAAERNLRGSPSVRTQAGRDDWNIQGR